MKTFAIWDALRARLGTAPAPARRIDVQHLGLPQHELDSVRSALEHVGRQLGVTLQLHGHSGEVVLLDVPFASRLSPQLMNALTEDRPVVLMPGLGADDGHGGTPEERAQRREEALLRQFGDLALVRRRSSLGAAAWGWRQRGTAQAPQPMPSSRTDAASGYDSGFDSEFDSVQLLAEETDRAHQDVVQRVLRGLRAPHTPPLSASYGPDANILFDFRSRLVHFDPRALQHLRVQRELPQPAPGARPGAEATVRELDETVWDIGLAAGPHRLLDEPADWWHTPLAAAADARVDRYSRLPRHLDMARRLQARAATPSELRRHAQVTVADVRRFVQAALMLNLIHWAPRALAGEA